MQLLDKQYDQKKYLDFLRGMFDLSEFLKPIDTINEDVVSFEQLGFITTADEKELPVFEIHIKPDTKLERNRVGLRNLVAKEVGTNDGALAVFVDNDNKQWRFSFISIEYELVETGVKTQQTSSKRFTYLFGEGAKTRTATERFDQLNQRSTLDDLKAAFAVEALSKEFYGKLYQWYETAQQQVKFPNGKQAQNHIQTSLIRLLTRLLFVWFLKEKKLINPDLFELAELKNIIDWKKDSSFYKAILQNLFFATLSTKIQSRKFRSEVRGYKGFNPDFGNQYVFRYQKLFKNPDDIKNVFNNIPFLNGGLFECLDNKENGVYIDGFTHTQKHQPTFQNQLLFNDNEKNLGLIDLFNQYQFTVEESTPLDIEVALDPELLGKVFENLLASYNSETDEQVRKATGSFYTPREIVSYMVDESLKQYFKTHINLDEKIINNLFIEGENKLKEAEIKAVIKAINDLKILDPAVGSGAFPMGILQRLVFILEKIDPENTHFKNQQLEKLPSLASIKQDLQTVEKISDQKAKEKATKELKRRKTEINDEFEQKDHNYLRKLHLIENCIYGVDIDLIAILIAQLRFFISLTIEQKTNDHQSQNFGITPLPNLDYHLEVGDSLIGLPAGYRSENMPPIVKDLLAEIKPLKHQFFSENDTQNKKALKNQIQKKIRDCYSNIEASIGYKVDFDFTINLNEVFTNKSDGFDIVLGNPPYIRQEKIKQGKEQFKKDYKTFVGTADIYICFYEKGVNLLNDNGHLCYITSNKWMRTKYGEKLRVFFKQQTGLKQIIDFEGKQIFENATVNTNILLCGTNKTDSFNYQKQLPDKQNLLLTMKTKDLSDNAYTLQPPEILALKNKIERIGTPLKDWDINIYRGVLTGFNGAFIIDNDTKQALCEQDPKSAEIIKPILKGRDIKAYEHHWAELWIIATFPALKINIDNYPAVKKYLQSFGKRLHQIGEKGTRKKTGNKWFETQDQIGYHAEFTKEKIIYPNMTKFLPFIHNNTGIYTNQKCFIITGNHLKYLTAYLNSKLFKSIFKNNFPELQGGTRELSKVFFEQIPVPKIPKPAQQPFVELVDKILMSKDNNKEIKFLKEKIDQIVYDLYQLNESEIKLISSLVKS